MLDLFSDDMFLPVVGLVMAGTAIGRRIQAWREDRKIHSLLEMESKGCGVYVSEADRIKYARKLPPFDEKKPYEPVPGVRYIPHWYLKDPLPRNAKPKPLVDELGHPISTSKPDDALGQCDCFDCRDDREHPAPPARNPNQHPASGNTSVLPSWLRLIGELVEMRGTMRLSRKTYESLEVIDGSPILSESEKYAKEFAREQELSRHWCEVNDEPRGFWGTTSIGPM